MASQRRQNVVPFPSPAARLAALESVRVRMLPAPARPLPAIAEKSTKLHVRDPRAAAIIERLLDDLLAEVG